MAAAGPLAPTSPQPPDFPTGNASRKRWPEPQPELRWNKQATVEVAASSVCSVSPLPPLIDMNTFRYMNDPPQAKREALNQRLRKAGDALRSQWSLGEFARLSDISQEERNYLAVVRSCSLVGGVVQCVVDGPWAKGNPHGARLSLQLDTIPSLTLYPGKIIAFRGKNLGMELASPDADGKGILLVSQLFELPALPTSCSLPRIPSSGEAMEEDTGGSAVRAVLCCGPYAANQMLTIRSLEELLWFGFAKRHASVMVFCGPFLPEPSRDEPVSSSMMYDDMFDAITEQLTSAVKKLVGLKVVLVPSLQDVAAAEYVFPQPPFDVVFESEDVIGVGNPSVIRLVPPGCTLGLCTTDILHHLSRAAVELNPEVSQARIPRLAAQVVRSRSFYPLVPAAPEAQLDFSHQRFLEFPGEQSPDVLVLPSVLSPFAQKIDGALVVNPGLVHKRSFAELTVAPPAGPTDTSCVADRCVVEFFRVP
eukprot:RCo000991